jgi:hypothetical protein
MDNKGDPHPFFGKKGIRAFPAGDSRAQGKK